MKINFFVVMFVLVCLPQLVYGQNQELEICSEFSSDTWHSISLPFSSGAVRPSLALNESELPCIAYLQIVTDGYELCYSEYNGTNWETFIVDTGPALPSLAFTSEGTAMIAAGHGGDNSLNLYEFNQNEKSWTKSVVYQTSPGEFFDVVNLSIDNSNRPHIAWYMGNSWNLFYGCDLGSGWEIKNDFGDKNGPDLEIDTNGNPYISHAGEQGSMSDLYCTFQYESQWLTSIISGYGSYGYTSIALSSDERAHVATASSFDLILVKDIGPTWVTEVVDPVGYVDLNPDMKIGVNDDIFIAYYDGLNMDLRVASNSGSGWDIEVVDWEGDTGNNPSLALSSQNHIYIAYNIEEYFYRGTEYFMQLKWFGSDLGTEEEETQGMRPDLHPVCPNPVAGSLSLSFFLPIAGEVNINIYDATGRIINNIAEYYASGDHLMTITSENLSPGVYFCHMSFSSHVESQRFVVIN